MMKTRRAKDIDWMLLLVAFVMALLCAMVAAPGAHAQSASLLPNGEQQFADANGVPYAAGKVYFYVPNSSTPKTTWIDPNKSVANANPVVLDAAGRATIYGDGQYREVVFDQYGNTIWDKLTFGQGTLTVPPIYIGTIANLQALSTAGLSIGYTVGVSGYYNSGDAPMVLYTLSSGQCALGGGSGDGGSQILASSANQCWLLGNQSRTDVKNFGAVGNGSSTTATANVATPTTVALADGTGFYANQHIAIAGGGPAFTLNPPTAVAIATEGLHGTQTYCVQIVAIDSNQGYGAATTQVCGAGDGVLNLRVPDDANGAAWDQVITWNAPSGTAPTSYAIYDNCTTGATNCDLSQGMKCRAVSTQNTWRDYGQPGGCPSWLPTTPPVAPRADMYQGVIASINGNTATLRTPGVVSNVSGGTVVHDDGVPIQLALNVEPTVYLQCGDYNLVSGLTVALQDGQALRGAGKECANLVPTGTYDVVTLTTPGWTVGDPFTSSLTAGDFSITASGMASGYAMKVYHARLARLDHILVISAYNELLAQDSFIGEVTNFYSFSQRRGDVGIHEVGTGSGGGLGQQLTNFDFTLINSGSAYQGISWHINGNVAATRARHLGMQVSPTQLVINNAIGAAQVATYIQGYDVGFNVCWNLCMHVATGTLVQLFSPYIQQVSAQGTNPYAVLLDAVDAVAVPSTGSLGTQFFGGTIFGGDVAIKDNGTGTVVSGSNVFTTLGQTAAIECSATSTGLSVTGGNSYTITSNLPSGQADYGIKLDAGCTRPTILGDWIGTTAGVLNNASPGSDVTINGQFNPPPTEVVTGGSTTLTAAGHPNLYTGGPGYVPNLEVSGSVGTPTFTTDTAAAIVASLFHPYVGQPIWFNVRNHDHNSGTPAVITIAGGAGVTVSGTATVPDSGGSGMYSSRMFKGTITNIGGGTEAIALKGCSTVSGAAC